MHNENNTVYFRRKTKKPYTNTLNNGHGNRGYIKFTKNLLGPDCQYYNGYEIVIWDGRAWYDNVNNQILLTLDEAKKFIQREYGGTWSFSENDITR